MDAALEDLGPRFARWLAPYVADELESRGAGRAELGLGALSDNYDAPTCTAFVSALTIETLTKAGVLFGRLERDGSIDSVTLAADLSLGTPRNLPGPLTTPLKRRAKKLGLPVPWKSDVSEDDHTVWRDRDGIGGRMVEAIRDEQQRRN